MYYLSRCICRAELSDALICLIYYLLLRPNYQVPGLLLHQFYWLEHKGLLQKGDFLNCTNLYFLEHYRDNLHLPPTELFRYNQITSYIKTKL